MPAPLAVDKEQVRMLVMAHGPREAARRCNLKEGTVLAWSKRGGWLKGIEDTASLVSGSPTPAKTALAATLPESMRPTVVIGAIKPADALAESLAEDSRETRLSLSRAARNMAKQAETADLDQAGDALQVGKLATLAHGWDDGKGSQVNINVLIQ